MTKTTKSAKETDVKNFIKCISDFVYYP